MSELYDTLAQASGRERLRRQLRDGYRRSMRLTALSTLLPGAGLVRTRHRVIGWVLLALVAGSALFLAYAVLTQGAMQAVLGFVSSPSALQFAAIGALVLGVLWAASIILTAVSSRPSLLDRSRTRALAVFTAVMVAFVATGSYKAAEYALITKDTLVDVFGAAPTNPNQAKVVAGKDPWADTRRVNILLLGSDAGVDRIGTRTDSMIVASIDTKTGRTVLISLPRNLEKAPLPTDSPLRQWYPSGVYGEPECFRLRHDKNDPCLLNAIWTEADEYRAEHPDSYPGEDSPGRYETRRVISEIVGLKINHTVIVDLKGFVRLVDAMGGIDINVKGGGYDGRQPLPIGGHRDEYGNLTGVKSYFKLGQQHLSGYYALWYARTRAADDDTHRQARQRCVVRAIVDQVNPAAMIGKYGELAQILKDNIYTDIPVENLPAFVELIERVKKAKMSSLPLTADHKIMAGDPDYTLARALVKKAIAPPAPAKPRPSTAPTSPAGSKTAPPPAPTTSPTTTTADVDDC